MMMRVINYISIEKGVDDGCNGVHLLEQEKGTESFDHTLVMSKEEDDYF